VLDKDAQRLILLAFVSYEVVRVWWWGGSSGLVGFEKSRYSGSIPISASSTLSLLREYTASTLPLLA